MLNRLNTFFKKTNEHALLPEEDQIRITNAIAKAEIATSGEIRIYIEKRCPQLTPMDRASEVFFKLEMDETEKRNGVLIYLALDDKVTAIFGDEGIYKKTGGNEFWQDEIEMFISFLRNKEIVEGLEKLISDLGFALAEYFPYEPGVDKNELPDAIVFGS